MKVFNIIFGILAILCGILCIFNPGPAGFIYRYVVAAFIGIWGLCAIVMYFVNRNKPIENKAEIASNIARLILGILGLIFGILHFTIEAFAVKTEGIVVAIVLIDLLFEGIMTLVSVFTTYKEQSAAFRLITSLFGVFVILVSCAGLANIWVVIASLGLFLGIALMIKGFELIFNAFALKN